jgi:hypothetical protein
MFPEQVEQLQSYLSRTSVAYQKEIMRLRGVVASNSSQLQQASGNQSYLSSSMERNMRSTGDQ